MRKIYHGSVKIIEKPQYGAGRRDNDYGLGFYCTEDIELAKEWAAADERGGFVNCYEVDENGMSYLNLQQVPERRQRLRGAQPPAQMGGGVDLSTEEEVVLQWMAILVDNRSVRLGSPVERRGKEFLCTHLLPDISKYRGLSMENFLLMFQKKIFPKCKFTL